MVGRQQSKMNKHTNIWREIKKQKDIESEKHRHIEAEKSEKIKQTKKQKQSKNVARTINLIQCILNFKNKSRALEITLQRL